MREREMDTERDADKMMEAERDTDTRHGEKEIGIEMEAEK